MRQQELIYNAEFQIQQMERKVARGLGERSDEEKNKLNAEIAHHEAELAWLHRHHTETRGCPPFSGPERC